MWHHLRDSVKVYGSYLVDAKAITSTKQKILIVSHMRSRSTLLAHILGSHPEICGYRELHSPYANWLDEFKTRAHLHTDRAKFNQARYLLDKLLHNKLVIDERLVRPGDKLIFLLREPEGTFRSMVKMHKKLFKTDRTKHLAKYYVERLDAMGAYFNVFRQQAFFIDSDRIVDDSSTVLQELEAFLGLETAISSHYQVFERTGRPGDGDMSGNITSGFIAPRETGVESSELPDSSNPDDGVDREGMHGSYQRLLAEFTHA